jgi:hypothetical protein
MNEVDFNTARELMGHADLKMTLRYAHLAPKTKMRAVETLEDNHPEVSIVFDNCACFVYNKSTVVDKAVLNYGEQARFAQTDDCGK